MGHCEGPSREFGKVLDNSVDTIPRATTPLQRLGPDSVSSDMSLTREVRLLLGLLLGSIPSAVCDPPPSLAGSPEHVGKFVHESPGVEGIPWRVGAGKPL